MTTEMRPKLIGASVKRLEDPRLLTGQGTFVDDLQPRRVVHVALRRSDQAHARIVDIRTEAARQAPGVVGIFTAGDLKAVLPLRAQSRMRGYYPTPLRPLAEGKVRYVGEPVVAVVAESRYLAEDAAELIEIAYDPLPTAVDAEAAAAEDAPLLHEEAGSNVIIAREFVRGDVDMDIARADVRVGGRFRFNRKTPAAIENRAAVAEYRAGSLTLHSTTQVPGIIRDALSEALGLPTNSVRVVAPDVGGGFGGKSNLYPEEVLVSALARELGRPVKWTGDRMEDLLSTGQAFDEVIDAELGLTADGKIVGLKADVTGDVGAYSIYPWTAGLEPVQVVSFLPGPYRVPSYRGRTRGVLTPKPPAGPYRGVGRPVSTFVMERLMDMAAARLNLDPRELRLRNLIAPEEFPYRTAPGLVWDRAEFIECLNKACAAAGYDQLRRKQAEAREQGRWVGIGIACYAELTGIGSRISAAPGMPINTGTDTATIRVDSGGTVTASFGIASHGQGLETTLAQIVAQELGVRVGDVKIVHGDSAAVAHGTGTYASRSTVLAGGAAILASRAVREKVVKIAAHLLEAPENEIETADGEIFVPGTNRKMTFAELGRAVHSDIGRLPKEVREELEATRLYDPFFGTASTAAHIAQVEIDPETFVVSVQRYLVAEDCGRIVNPLIVEGQVHGGVAQGIGAALLEEVIHDGQGQALTASLVDYLVPSAAEIPPIGVVHVESESPSTLGGFRGMGEGGTIGAPAAIANAVSDALRPLGVEINAIPASPERLFQMVRKTLREHEAGRQAPSA
ncbi:MAG TPA: xanthine dehydrogenase family protein molybdopterin-binding subunit [Hyphomicrobiaceae bacterium]|nr:xanthine dehydrogenase family protein molybdopterin-binding subunit [Hyphomicrobiaceae bacterium]